MKRFTITFVLLLFIATASPHTVLAGSGTFSSVKGRVFLKKQGRREKRARRGLKIGVGESVRTTSGAYAKITMSDKNIIHVGPATELVFDEYKTEKEDGGAGQVTLSVLYGKVRTVLEQKYDGKKRRFNIRTEAAVLGVRGTDFITEHNETAKLTRVTTITGLVNISESGDTEGVDSINLGPGMSIVVLAGEGLSETIQLPNDILDGVIGSVSSSGSAKAKGVQQEIEAAVVASNPMVMIDSKIDVLRKPPAALADHLIERNIVNSLSADADAEVTIDIENGI